MPDTRQTLYRQWLMLRLLPRAPARTTAGELAQRIAAEGLVVSKRSIERDLQALGDVFPIVCDDRSKPFGWSWARDAPSFGLPGMTPAQALVMLMANEHLRGLLPAGLLDELRPFVTQARQTLDIKRSGSGLSVWPDCVAVVPSGPPLTPPEVSPDVLREVHSAIVERCQISMTYTARGRTKSKSYDVHPIGLIQRGGVTYLACTPGEAKDVRLLALHRIQAAARVDRKAVASDASVLAAARDMVRSGFDDRGPIRLVMEMEERAADHVHESRLSDDQLVESSENDGWVLIRATVSDTAQLRWWLLGYGEHVEILEPPSLRSWITEVLNDAGSYYA